MDGGRVKTASVCHRDRIPKCNRLLEIEQEVGERASFHL
jgi:enolase